MVLLEVDSFMCKKIEQTNISQGNDMWAEMGTLHTKVKRSIAEHLWEMGNRSVTGRHTEQCTFSSKARAGGPGYSKPIF